MKHTFPLITTLLFSLFAPADDSILHSRHDLSSSGPGPVRALNEDQVCIFCHTPHNASPAAPLWNRHNPRTHYRVYSSSTTDARIDQPGGSSKLCLSCHDGSIAIGLVASRRDPIPLTHPFIPTGDSDLTSDLSDDHPIGFRFDRQLANRDPQLRSPDLVDHRIPLGPRGELECTACHDPHNNELGDFLRLPLRSGTLCVTCHQMDGWRSGAHANSPRRVPISLTHENRLPFSSMADNSCLTCHDTHGAAQRERLLRARPYDLCISCHDGLTGRDVLSVIGQRSAHRPNRFAGLHRPDEDPRTMRPHVDCIDCHDPHATRENVSGHSLATPRIQGPLYMPTLENVPGVTLAGTTTIDATYYYEVCFRCHSDNAVISPRRIVRQRDDAGNIRRQFLPNAASAHPVAFSARRAGENPSLTPEARSMNGMNCQSCHNNPDARQLGGSGPNGPHGSPFEFLLAARYETADFTAESLQSYALCYQCHERQSILGDESFAFHNLHVVRERTPCSACHTPHGVSGNSTEHGHLINFDTAIVQGERRYEDLGVFAGSCTLTCHGVRHVRLGYRR